MSISSYISILNVISMYTSHNIEFQYQMQYRLQIEIKLNVNFKLNLFSISSSIDNPNGHVEVHVPKDRPA